MKRYLMAGLLVWVPLGITIWVLHFLVTTLDQTLLLFPEVAQPDRLLGVHIPGFGVLLSFGLLLLTGVIAANFFGARLTIKVKATQRMDGMNVEKGDGLPIPVHLQALVSQVDLPVFIV